MKNSGVTHLEYERGGDCAKNDWCTLCDAAKKTEKTKTMKYWLIDWLIVVVKQAGTNKHKRGLDKDRVIRGKKE